VERGPDLVTIWFPRIEVHDLTQQPNVMRALVTLINVAPRALPAVEPGWRQTSIFRR
jgi:hypothetical protein